MQAIVCKISPVGIAVSAPSGLITIGSSCTAIDYLELCHRRLVTEAETYGFDKHATYMIIIQTWDRASDRLRSLAYGRENSQRDLVKLIPDVYFIKSHGYANVRESTRRGSALPWDLRSPKLVWRGSVTGSGPYASPAEIPRVKLALACRDIDDTDVAIFQVHETMLNVYPPEEIETFVKTQALWGERWSIDVFGGYKFVVDIDGHANAWGLLEKLILGCCILKVSSPYEQWFYEHLRPWRHYVPIRSDLTDLDEIFAWCRENNRECEWIAKNGATLARSLTLENAVDLSCFDVMSAASLQQSF